MRILYVDDDRLNAFLFERLCEAAGGLEVECASSGAEARQCVGDWHPDLLILDLHLPDTDGYALLPLLRDALDAPNLPALLCTADHPDEVRAAAHAAGFDGCLAKPIDLQAIARLRDRPIEHP